MEIIIVLIIVGIYVLLKSNSNSDQTKQNSFNSVVNKKHNGQKTSSGVSKSKKELAIEKAMNSGDAISIVYEDKEGNITKRTIKLL